MGNEAGLLVKLLGEEINSEVAKLTGLSRGGDANDLAGTALQDQEIADADVMAGDGDGVHVGSSASSAAFDVTDVFAR